MEKLLQTADAFLCTKRMQDMDLLGYWVMSALHALFPRLVYATLTCYGHRAHELRKGGDFGGQAFPAA